MYTLEDDDETSSRLKRREIVADADTKSLDGASALADASVSGAPAAPETPEAGKANGIRDARGRQSERDGGTCDGGRPHP